MKFTFEICVGTLGGIIMLSVLLIKMYLLYLVHIIFFECISS